MSDQNKGAGADASATTGAAGAASSQSQADAGAAGQGQKPVQGGEQPWMNKQEFIGLATTVRDLEKLVKEKLGAGGDKAGDQGKAKDKAADAPSEVQQLRRELQLKDAAADAGLTLEQRARLERLFKAESPPDVGAWVQATAKEMGWAKAADAAGKGDKGDAGGEKRKPVTSNLGAGGDAGGEQLPDDPRQIDPQIWKSLTPEKRRAIFEAYKTKTGFTQRPVHKPLPKI